MKTQAKTVEQDPAQASDQGGQTRGGDELGQPHSPSDPVESATQVVDEESSQGESGQTGKSRQSTSSELAEDPPPREPDKTDHILSMEVPVIVKIAEKTMTVSSILKLNLGSVITFEKDAHQHVDLMVNNSTIGLGRPVKIGENFGLRIIQINDIRETIKSLGGDGNGEQAGG